MSVVLHEDVLCASYYKEYEFLFCLVQQEGETCQDILEQTSLTTFLPVYILNSSYIKSH